MNEHPQFAEDIDLLALGLLEAGGSAALRAHMADCGECRARYEEARGISALLSLSTPVAEPPARARERLLAQLNAERVQTGASDRGAVTAVPPRVAPRPARSSIREYLGWAVAAAVALMALGVTISQNRRTQAELAALHAQIAAKQDELDRTRAVLDLLRSTDAMRVHLVSSTAPWPWPEGKVFYQPKNGLLFMASHLPPLDPGKAYQLWCVPEEGSPASAGVFAPDAKGNATLMLHRVSVPMKPKTFAVTIEPEGGAPEPTGPQVMVGEQ
jgi:anti-sigma-K factor RskA